MINKVVSYFVPEIPDAPEDEKKGRIVFSLIFIVTLIAIFLWFVTHFFLSEFDNGISYPLIILPCIGLLFLYKYTRSLEWVATGLVTLCFVMLIPVTHNSGGIFSDDLLWMIIAPFLAFLIGGKRIGLISSVFYLGVIGYFYYLEKNAVVTYFEQSNISNADFYFSSIFFLVTSLLLILWIYETEKSRYSKKINENRKLLEQQKEKLEEEVAKRTQSLKVSNESLQRSNKDLEQFAYIASHDLQEPLRMVGNFVQLLESEYQEELDEDAKTYINFAVDGVNRMSNLIDDLLNYSRAGRKNLPLEECNVAAVLDKKKEDLNLVLKQKKGQIIYNKMPTILCYENYLSIIFNNLITNGLKYNQSEIPTIEIGYKDEGEYHVFSVKDNGIGINMEYKNQIFEIFKRLHRKEEYSGTGIGLAIVQKLVYYHKGEVWLDSEEGKGTTFFFSVFKGLK